MALNKNIAASSEISIFNQVARNALVSMRCATFCIITKVDTRLRLVNCKPIVKEKVTIKESPGYTYMELPELINVPYFHPIIETNLEQILDWMNTLIDSILAARTIITTATVSATPTPGVVTDSGPLSKVAELNQIKTQISSKKSKDKSDYSGRIHPQVNEYCMCIHSDRTFHKILEDVNIGTDVTLPLYTTKRKNPLTMLQSNSNLHAMEDCIAITGFFNRNDYNGNIVQ